MLCHKDRTFCPYYCQCNHGDSCSAALTKEVEEDSEKAGLPISQFAEKPNCFEEICGRGD